MISIYLKLHCLVLLYFLLKDKHAHGGGGGHKDTTMNSFGCGEAPAENVNVQGPEFCADFSCK